MNMVKRFFVAVSLSSLFLLAFACAKVPAPVAVQQDTAFAKAGDTVNLFHGGNAAARDEFCVNSVVPVYRPEGRYSTVGSTAIKKHEVGKIKITKDLGDYYVEGVVVEGNIKSGDVAVQPRSGCLVRVPGPEEK